ncbi:MAG TPA: hypothetical protein VK950_07515 [Methylophilus sp.]|nr:hypothetical protein [Methylophilus sp.]
MLDKTMIEPMHLDDREGEMSSQHTSVREEKLQNREGKSCSRTVKQALAIHQLKTRKTGEHMPE